MRIRKDCPSKHTNTGPFRYNWKIHKWELVKCHPVKRLGYQSGGLPLSDPPIRTNLDGSVRLTWEKRMNKILDEMGASR